MAADDKICYADDVREITDLDEDDIHDTQLELLIDSAWKKVMADTGKRVNLVRLDYIDQYRKNTIDGSNTTYYIPESWNKFFGDMDYDHSIDTDDVTVYEYANDYTRSAATVSSIDETGSFVLSSAPSAGSHLRATYLVIPISITDDLYKEACKYLAASMVHGRLDAGDYESVNFRGLGFKNIGMSKGYDSFFMKYKEKVRDIIQYGGLMRRGDDAKRQYPFEEVSGYVEPSRQ